MKDLTLTAALELNGRLSFTATWNNGAGRVERHLDPRNDDDYRILRTADEHLRTRDLMLRTGVEPSHPAARRAFRAAVIELFPCLATHEGLAA